MRIIFRVLRYTHLVERKRCSNFGLQTCWTRLGVLTGKEELREGISRGAEGPGGVQEGWTGYKSVKSRRRKGILVSSNILCLCRNLIVVQCISELRLFSLWVVSVNEVVVWWNWAAKWYQLMWLAWFTTQVAQQLCVKCSPSSLSCDVNKFRSSPYCSWYVTYQPRSTFHLCCTCEVCCCVVKSHLTSFIHSLWADKVVYFH